MGGGSSSTSVSGSAQKWATPIATSAANNAQNVYSQNQPKLQALSDNIYGMIPGLQSNIGSNNANVHAAQGYNADVLGGKYLTGNPYLQSQIDQMKRSVGSSVDSQFAAGGRYGSGAFADVLSRNLADGENNLRYNDYNQQMGRMDQAAQQAPGLAAANYVGLPEILQAAQTAGALPYTGSSATASALSALFNGGTQTQKQSGGIGGILGGLGSLASGIAAFGKQ